MFINFRQQKNKNLDRKNRFFVCFFVLNKMNTETETKLESKHVHNLSTNNNKNTKLIKCFCNDDIQCPPRSSSTSKNPLVDEDALKNPKLVSFLSQNKIEASASRFCLSETKCVTKRLQKRSGQTWLKYNCDQSMPESIRDKVIEYRDCRIHTDNMIDRTFVLENSPEYCCDNGDYCNVDLEPKRWVKDLADYAQQSQQTPPQIHDLHGGTAQQNHHDSLITPINLALSLLTLVGFIVALVLLITYLYRKVELSLNILIWYFLTISFVVILLSFPIVYLFYCIWIYIYT